MEKGYRIISGDRIDFELEINKLCRERQFNIIQFNCTLMQNDCPFYSALIEFTAEKKGDEQ